MYSLKLQLKKEKNDFFQVARIEEVMEVSDYRERISEDGTDPWCYVFVS